MIMPSINKTNVNKNLANTSENGCKHIFFYYFEIKLIVVLQLRRNSL